MRNQLVMRNYYDLYTSLLKLFCLLMHEINVIGYILTFHSNIISKESR
jgi:hypothetical protein